jgi:flagellin
MLGINKSDLNTNKQLERIQSGERINKAADDSSGMVISDSLRVQHMGLAQGTRNAENATALMNIADGALTTYKETLETMRDKAIQASSSTESGDSRKALQNDINALMGSLKQIAAQTSYNGINLLNGQFSNKEFQVGAYSNQTVAVTIRDASIEKIGHFNGLKGQEGGAGETSKDLSINGKNISQTTLSDTNKDGVNLTVEAINAKSNETGVTASANTQVNGNHIIGGTLANGDIKINGIAIGAVSIDPSDTSGNLLSAINNVSNQTGVTARIDAGKLILSSTNGENVHITGNITTDEEGIETSAVEKAGLEIGTNFGQITLFSEDAINIENASIADGLSETSIVTKTLANADVTTMDEAQDTISIFENAIKEIDAVRADVGAATNQIERVVEVNNVTEKNIKEAEDTIRGADISATKEQFDKWNIRNQAAMYAFSMASQQQQSLLSLLK